MVQQFFEVSLQFSQYLTNNYHQWTSLIR